IFMLALVAGGCGSSSSSVSTGGGGVLNPSGNYILIDPLDHGRDITHHIDAKITDRLSLAEFDALDEVSLSSKHIIFISDASKISPDSYAVSLLNKAFYDQGAALAAVYPDAEDVEALGDILGLSLVGPEDEPSNKHFEVVAASMRYISGDILPHTFIYVDKCTENSGNYPTNYTVSKDAPVVNVDPASWDVYFGEAVTTPTASEQAALSRDYEAHAQLILARRVQNVIDWVNGIDDRAAAHREEIISQASRFAFEVADQTGGRAEEILKFVGGIQTDFHDDSVTGCFYNYDYSRRHGTQASEWNTWTDYSGCNNYGTLKDHWNSFNPGLDITGTHVSYGVHAFEDHCDYYLITTTATIQPHSRLEIRAEYGDTTGDEVKGSGAYHYAVILGCNKKLECYLWPNELGTELVKITPSMTVNNNQSFSDTDGWQMGGGVSGGGSVTRGTSSKDAQTGAGGKLDGSFNYSVSHNATHTWQTTDYSITPSRTTALYPADGRPVIGWVLDVTSPYYSGGKGWVISPAAKTAVTLEGESIWRVQPDHVDKPSFNSQAHWSEGFFAAHDMGGRKVSDASCTINHYTNYKGLNLTKPVRFGIGDFVSTGTSAGKMYTAKVYSELNWTASSNADWLTLADRSMSGGAANGDDFVYTVTQNTTGATRTGTITVTTEDKKTYTLTFTQSPYAN
ncbi:MAG: BACON domain-containing protein, partial [Synergistaceae bacterium]|nr:BACON domain-containing protein [Synergistaceae bacterium]